ncbi:MULTISPECIES: hypothetical protein [Rhizobium]|uniref:DUF1127 domain-containing protein n=1 Tax=Rhizobium wuzhouense TaxID=1986026 RepID=A0ABX5NY32_9HYPH|nr:MULTISPECIES: hypothetical protein [Rhizobium]PYB75109.1 hypothetical protein DMY87_06465 [Rhizobium wuzhouense]RKE84683.1 hypothetical protein DFO46_1454 [Rhizobium sp. AG855]
MPQPAFTALGASLTKAIAHTRNQATLRATKRELAPLTPALRDDLGLTRLRQLITFQNDRHQKHSLD